MSRNARKFRRKHGGGPKTEPAPLPRIDYESLVFERGCTSPPGVVVFQESDHHKGHTITSEIFVTATDALRPVQRQILDEYKLNDAMRRLERVVQQVFVPWTDKLPSVNSKDASWKPDSRLDDLKAVLELVGPPSLEGLRVITPEERQAWLDGRVSAFDLMTGADALQISDTRSERDSGDTMGADALQTSDVLDAEERDAGRLRNEANLEIEIAHDVWVEGFIAGNDNLPCEPPEKLNKLRDVWIAGWKDGLRELTDFTYVSCADRERGFLGGVFIKGRLSSAQAIEHVTKMAVLPGVFQAWTVYLGGPTAGGVPPGFFQKVAMNTNRLISELEMRTEFEGLNLSEAKREGLC